MKVHRFSVTSLSIKNLMGVLMMKGNSNYLQANKMMIHKEINTWFGKTNISTEEKKKQYKLFYEVFSERLIDLFVIAKSDFTIIEGFQVTEGDGFDRIKLRDEHIAFASYNHVYADYTATAYMGFIDSEYLQKNFNFDKPIYLKEAISRFYPKIKKLTDVKIIKSEDINFNNGHFWFIPMIKH